MKGEDGATNGRKSYAGCYQNKYFIPPEMAHGQAATQGMIIDSDFELDSEVAEDAAGEDGGGAEEERPDDDYDYDGYDYDDDEFDSQSYGYDSEVYVFDFSDSEYEGEAPPT